MDLPRRLAAEFLGTLFLLAAVIGSGIMADDLAGGNDAVALLGNTLATGAILAVLILVYGAVSGAHFNPAVTFAFLLRREIAPGDAAAYAAAQFAGAFAGALLAHLMFGEPALSASQNPRTGVGVWTGELVAAFGLLATILGCLRHRPEALPWAVGLFIAAGYWFTSSTSFANPAVTAARAWTDTFTGIRPQDAPMFIAMQFAGAALAVGAFGWLLGRGAQPSR